MTRAAWHHDRTSRHARGYGTAWDKLRLQILERDSYLCQCAECKVAGLVKNATDVDHIVSKAAWQRKRGNLDGVDDPSNLQAINRECHQRKTSLERGHRPKEATGADGFPLDPEHAWNRK